MTTYIVTQGIQGPEGAQGATGPAGATAQTVYSTYVLTTEEIILGAGGGGTITEGVSISFVDGQDLPEGSRAVVYRTAGGFESYLATGAEWLYEDPQLSTFAGNGQGGQATLLQVTVDASTGGFIQNVLYQMFSDGVESMLVPLAVLPEAIPYNNTDSGLTADNAQAALDELAASGGTTTYTVRSTIAVDLTGVFTVTDPIPTPVGWMTAIFGQADQSVNGIWEGQTPLGDTTPEDYLPMVKRAELPTENGVIFSEFLQYDMDTLMAPPGGGWIIAQATQVDGDAGGIDNFGALPGDGWAVVYGTQYWLDTIAMSAAAVAEVRSTITGNTQTDDHTITWASDIQGPVYTMEAATDKTFTLDETSGGWASGAILRFHNIGTALLTVEPDAAATFTAGATNIASFSVLPGGWAQAWRSPNNDGEWIITGDGEAWLWDGVTDYLPAYGARRFFGPNDPAGEGFTLADGDKWEDTTP